MVLENGNISILEVPPVNFLTVNAETVRLFIWIISSVVCQTINIFGITTNVINILCFVKQGFKDAVNVSLLGLAVSDLGCLLTLTWMNICQTPPFQEADLPFDPVEISYIAGSMPHFVFSRVTNCITAMITVERCLCIIYPLKVKTIVTPKLIATIILCVYLISIICAAPTYVVNKLGMKFNPLLNRSVLRLVFMEDRETVEKISFFINNFSIPLTAFIIIVVSTIVLIQGLQRATNWRQQSTQDQTDRIYNRNQKVAKMVLMIAILFIVCFIPINIIVIAFLYDPNLSFTGKYFVLTIMLGALGLCLESINSSVNIFIYYHMSSKYRDIFREIVCKNKIK